MMVCKDPDCGLCGLDKMETWITFAAHAPWGSFKDENGNEPHGNDLVTSMAYWMGQHADEMMKELEKRFGDKHE